MTTEQQKETALRLFRLAWRSSEQAPEAEEQFGYSSSIGRVDYYGKTEEGAVYAFVRRDGRASVHVCVRGNSAEIEGTACYVETMLRLIPVELRPYVENTK